MYSWLWWCCPYNLEGKTHSISLCITWNIIFCLTCCKFLINSLDFTHSENRLKALNNINFYFEMYEFFEFVSGYLGFWFCLEGSAATTSKAYDSSKSPCCYPNSMLMEMLCSWWKFLLRCYVENTSSTTKVTTLTLVSKLN